MPQKVYEAILGEPDAGFYRMTEDQIRRYFIARPIGSSVTHVKELRQQQMQMMTQILGNVAPLAAQSTEPFTINWYQAAKTSLEAADIKNADQILIKMQPEQIQQQQQQMMMQKQQAVQEQLKMVSYGEEIKQGTAAKYKVMTDNNEAKNKILIERTKAQANPKPTIGGNQ
jgi:hypothetical protein